MALEQDPALILEACQAQLAGLDEDILEYITGVIESSDGGEDYDDLVETISGFLLSSGVHESEDEAGAVVTELLAKLTVQQEVHTSTGPEAPSAAPKTIGAICKAEFEEAGAVLIQPLEAPSRGLMPDLLPERGPAKESKRAAAKDAKASSKKREAAERVALMASLRRHVRRPHG